MAKYHGKVGYGIPYEKRPGVWDYLIEEQVYYGDVLTNIRRLEPGEGQNDDISVSNRISIMADDRAINDFEKIKYVTWAGTYWKVASVTVQGPRLVLSLGGVYNGRKA